MKKWLVILLGAFVFAGCTTKENNPSSITTESVAKLDPVATANAPWKVGEVIIDNAQCHYPSSRRECYTIFLGILDNRNILIQDLFAPEVKHTDPYEVRWSSAAKESPYERYFLRGAINGKLMIYHRENNEQRYYKNGSTTGTWIVWYGNGNKKSEINLKDSIYEGDAIYWYENGQMSSKSTYKNVRLEGNSLLWYEDGKMKEETHYKDGKKDGLHTLWHENGKKKMHGLYKKGDKVGVWREWDKNGRLTGKRDYGNPK